MQVYFYASDRLVDNRSVRVIALVYDSNKASYAVSVRPTAASSMPAATFYVAQAPMQIT